jgi:hypothetical protein
VRLWALRLATAAVFAAVVVVGWARFHPHAHQREAGLKPGEVSVAEGLATSRNPITLRGWVFNDPALGPAGLRLCNAYHPGSPPSCVGPFVDLYDTDPGAFSLRAKKGVRWGAEPIAVYGTLDGTALTVQAVLR